MKNLTPGEVAAIVIAALLALAGAIVTIGNAVEKLLKVWRAAKAPNDEQDRRITELEKWRTDVDRKLGNDKTELDAMRDANHAIFKALLALLDHGIDGNNIKQMEDAKQAVRNHLIDNN